VDSVERIMNSKFKLLSAKSGDTFKLPFYIDGWRECDIKVGRKWGFVKPMFGNYTTKRYTAGNIKRELKSLYWYAAKCDAGREALENGRYKRKRGWEQHYA